MPWVRGSNSGAPRGGWKTQYLNWTSIDILLGCGLTSYPSKSRPLPGAFAHQSVPSLIRMTDRGEGIPEVL